MNPKTTARSWRMTGVHGSPTSLRLADGHGPPMPAPEEEIAIVELGSWPAALTAIRAAWDRNLAQRTRHRLGSRLRRLATTLRLRFRGQS